MSPNSAPFMPIDIRPGSPYPLGATVIREEDGASGVNFSLFSARAPSIDLLLFDRFDD